MVMPEFAKRWTREMVLALPDDGNRYELFEGQLLVTPAPDGLHQLALVRLYDLVAPYVRARGLGETMLSPADLSLGGEQLSQPDLFVLPSLPTDRRDWSGYPDPVLVVEVLSPGTERLDRTVKRRRFQRAGIPDYWIVDLDRRAVEVWHPTDRSSRTLDQRLDWHPAGAGSALTIDLPRYFDSVWGRPA